jgi:hypothetical protein
MKEKQDFIYRDTTNVKCGIYDYTRNNCSHRNSNKGAKETFGSRNKKTFKTFTTKDNHRTTSYVTHKTGSTAVCNLKSERRETTVGSRGEVPGTEGLFKRQQKKIIAYV